MTWILLFITSGDKTCITGDRNTIEFISKADLADAVFGA
jgi:hypothetical protein